MRIDQCEFNEKHTKFLEVANKSAKLINRVKLFASLYMRIVAMGSKELQPELLVLNQQNDYMSAGQSLAELGLRGHHDIQKNWDLKLCLDELSGLPKDSLILDAGSGTKAVFANSAVSMGFKNLYACDLQKPKGNDVVCSVQDIMNTNYRNEMFDVVCSISVIEHGVDLELFFREMYRLTKRGGKLCVSTDFWPIPEDHSNKFPYGENNPPMNL